MPLTTDRRRRFAEPAGRLLALALAAAVASCASPGETFECVEDLDTGCQPLFDPPTFQAIYDNTLHPTCASSNACHNRAGAQGGLVFEDLDEAYMLLLGQVDGRARVIPGNPSCSLIVERTEAPEPNLRMPPGSEPLPAAERCTIVQWILQGAEP